MWTEEGQYLKKKDQINKRKVFVRFLPCHTAEVIRNHFSQYGLIDDIDLKISMSTKLPRHFGYITFRTAESAHDASAQPIQLCMGQKIMCQMTTPFFVIKKERHHKGANKYEAPLSSDAAYSVVNDDVVNKVLPVNCQPEPILDINHQKQHFTITDEC